MAGLIKGGNGVPEERQIKYSGRVIRQLQEAYCHKLMPGSRQNVHPFFHQSQIRTKRNQFATRINNQQDDPFGTILMSGEKSESQEEDPSARARREYQELENYVAALSGKQKKMEEIIYETEMGFMTNNLKTGDLIRGLRDRPLEQDNFFVKQQFQVPPHQMVFSLSSMTSPVYEKLGQLQNANLVTFTPRIQERKMRGHSGHLSASQIARIRKLRRERTAEARLGNMDARAYTPRRTLSRSTPRRANIDKNQDLQIEPKMIRKKDRKP